MEAITLAAQPPRRPRADLAGIIFLPRSIDKARAALPGGDLGPYRLTGMTQVMLDGLGIERDAFVAAVAAAASDDDVAAFVHANTTPEKIAAWTALASAARSGNGDPAVALKYYPWVSERPDLVLGLDILEEDDKRYFAPRP